MHLTDEQEQAVALCRDKTKKIVCVTGQAGTGKTSTLQYVYDAIISDLMDQGMERFQAEGQVTLMAPTGRAAKRIEEATGISARTIHRSLRFSVPDDDDEATLPAYTKFNPMPWSFILVDEASMLSVDLRRNIIDAMKRDAVVRFFGDINQLPPVVRDEEEVISPFAMDIQKYPSVYLTKNFRSTDGIISLADRVIKNRMPLQNEQVKIHNIAGITAKTLLMQIAANVDFTSERNQIICPTRNTTYGSGEINRAIQQRFNDTKDKITIFKKEEGKPVPYAFKRGDKIIWIKNDYNINLINGTLGRVLDFNTETGSIFLNIDDRDVEVPSLLKAFNSTTGVEYTYDPRQYLELGYAITTHKSQGSQFDNVLFMLSRSRAATRQNVYTAVTRAKFNLEIINIAGALPSAMNKLVNIYAKS